MGWSLARTRELFRDKPHYMRQVEEQLRAGREGSAPLVKAPPSPVLDATAPLPASSPSAPPSPGPRQGSKGPNALELAWAAQLDADPDVERHEFESTPIELAHRCIYWPDVTVTFRDGSIAYDEVKGPHVWEDSRIKFKFASRLVPGARFRWIRYDAETGIWRIEVWKAGSPLPAASTPSRRAPAQPERASRT